MPQYVVCLSSWAGITYIPVEILERHRRRVKVRFLTSATRRHPQGSIGYPPYTALGHWEGETWVPLVPTREDTPF